MAASESPDGGWASSEGIGMVSYEDTESDCAGVTKCSRGVVGKWGDRDCCYSPCEP